MLFVDIQWCYNHVVCSFVHKFAITTSKQRRTWNIDCRTAWSMQLGNPTKVVAWGCASILLFPHSGNLFSWNCSAVPVMNFGVVLLRKNMPWRRADWEKPLVPIWSNMTFLWFHGENAPSPSEIILSKNNFEGLALQRGFFIVPVDQCMGHAAQSLDDASLSFFLRIPHGLSVRLVKQFVPCTHVLTDSWSNRNMQTLFRLLELRLVLHLGSKLLLFLFVYFITL